MLNLGFSETRYLLFLTKTYYFWFKPWF